MSGMQISSARSEIIYDSRYYIGTLLNIFDVPICIDPPRCANGNYSSPLNEAIDGLDLAKEFSSVTPANAVFGSVVSR